MKCPGCKIDLAYTDESVFLVCPQCGMKAMETEYGYGASEEDKSDESKTD
jgi:uncharacterized Zn ribbon protein